MYRLKKFRSIIILSLVFFLLIIYRSFSLSGFRYDAPKMAERSIYGSNLITESGINDLSDNSILVVLDSSEYSLNKYGFQSIRISPDSILSRKNLKLLKSYKGSVILTSSDNAISARIWMILAQKGFRNIFILPGKNNPEILPDKTSADSISEINNL